MIILKVTKKQSFTLSLEDTYLEKPHWGRGQIDSIHPAFLGLSSQQCTTPSTLINLHPNEYTKGIRYFPFVDVLEVVILLMVYLIKYVSQTKQNI